MTARNVKRLFDLTGKIGGSRVFGMQIAHVRGGAGARLMLSSRKADDLEHAAAEGIRNTRNQDNP